jgi:hypothetical protein
MAAAPAAIYCIAQGERLFIANGMHDYEILTAFSEILPWQYGRQLIPAEGSLQALQ